MSHFAADVRSGFRQLTRDPGFTALAVLALGLAIAAATIAFAIASPALLRGLGYHEPDRLVSIGDRHRSHPWSSWMAPPRFDDLRARATSFEGLAAQRWWSYTLGLPELEDTGLVTGARVTTNWFDVLGRTAALGRTFRPGEDAEDAPRVAVVSDRFWNERFGGDRNVLGRRVLLAGEETEVVGVMPADFGYPVPAFDVWTPIRLAAWEDERRARNLDVVARLRPGADRAGAQAEIARIGEELAAEQPEWDAGWTFELAPLEDALLREWRENLPLLVLAALGLLLIAHADVAGMLVAQVNGRRGELAVRAALGGRRLRLVRQLMTEGLVLAAAAGAFGMFLALWGVPLYAELLGPTDAPWFDRVVRVDGAAVAFTALLTLNAGLAVSGVAALSASRPRIAEALRQGDERMLGTPERTRLREWLVGAQIVIAFLFAVSAVEATQRLWELSRVDPGVDPDGVLTSEVLLPEKFYATPEDRQLGYDALLPAARAVPGVVDAAATNVAPFNEWGFWNYLEIEGEPPRPPGSIRTIQYHVVTPNYFDVMGIEFVAGGPFATQGDPDESTGMVVNEAAARTCFPDGEVLGTRVRVPDGRAAGPIVGIVRDLRSRGPAREPVPEIYVPARPNPWGAFTIVAREDGETPGVAAAVERALRRVEPRASVRPLRPLERSIEVLMWGPWSIAVMACTLAAIALVLGAVGLYAAVRHAVTDRTREIGIRMALGARGRDVARVLARRGLRAGLIGVAIGAPLAAGFDHAVTVGLLQLPAAGPLAYAVAALVVPATAWFASALPARRIRQLDPLRALRGVSGVRRR